MSTLKEVLTKLRDDWTWEVGCSFCIYEDRPFLSSDCKECLTSNDKYGFFKRNTKITNYFKQKVEEL